MGLTQYAEGAKRGAPHLSGLLPLLSAAASDPSGDHRGGWERPSRKKEWLWEGSWQHRPQHLFTWERKLPVDCTHLCPLRRVCVEQITQRRMPPLSFLPHDISTGPNHPVTWHPSWPLRKSRLLSPLLHQRFQELHRSLVIIWPSPLSWWWGLNGFPLEWTRDPL